MQFLTKYIFIISPAGLAIPYREVVSPTVIVSCDKLNGGQVFGACVGLCFYYSCWMACVTCSFTFL